MVANSRGHSFTRVFQCICIHSASPESLRSRWLQTRGGTLLLGFSHAFAYILHPQRASAVGGCRLAGALFYLGFLMHLHTFCLSCMQMLAHSRMHSFTRVVFSHVFAHLLFLQSSSQLQPTHPLCLQTLCKSFYDKICCVNAMFLRLNLHPSYNPLVLTNPM